MVNSSLDQSCWNERKGRAYMQKNGQKGHVPNHLDHLLWEEGAAEGGGGPK